MYGLIRLLISILVFIGIMVCSNRIMILKRKYIAIISIVISLFVFLALQILPFENLFVQFRSPEAAYKYYNDGDIKFIINGKTSAFVVASERNTDKYSIVLKTKNGWKIGMNYRIQMPIAQFRDGYIIYIYNYKEEPDDYAVIIDMIGNGLEIWDTLGTKFVKESSKNANTYYGYICINDDYKLYINGEAVDLMDNS